MKRVLVTLNRISLYLGYARAFHSNDVVGVSPCLLRFTNATPFLSPTLSCIRVPMCQEVRSATTCHPSPCFILFPALIALGRNASRFQVWFLNRREGTVVQLMTWMCSYCTISFCIRKTLKFFSLSTNYHVISSSSAIACRSDESWPIKVWKE